MFRLFPLYGVISIMSIYLRMYVFVCLFFFLVVYCLRLDSSEGPYQVRVYDTNLLWASPCDFIMPAPPRPGQTAPRAPQQLWVYLGVSQDRTCVAFQLQETRQREQRPVFTLLMNQLGNNNNNSNIMECFPYAKPKQTNQQNRPKFSMSQIKTGNQKMLR